MKASRVTGIALSVLSILLLAAGLAAWRADSGPGFFGLRGSGDGGLRFLSEEEFDRERASKREEDLSARDLLWQGGTAPCWEEAASVYIPCDPSVLQAWEESWTASDGSREDADSLSPVYEGWEEILAGLSAGDMEGYVCIREEEALRAPASALRQGHAFDAFLATERTVRPFQIILTGLPVLCLQKTDDGEIVRKEEHAGTVRLLPLQLQRDQDNDGAETLLCSFHVRGNSTSYFDKKPFRISLKDTAGRKYKVSWLGMRTDDDWVLNPIYGDASKVREKTAYQVWEAVTALSDHPQASSRMQYVELIMDNAYQGIYCLMEPVDGKQLGLGEGDLLYKINRWEHEDPYLDWYDPAEEARETDICNDDGLSCVTIRYPLAWDGTATWMPMKAFHSYVFQTGDLKTLEEAGVEADLDSETTLSLFCALAHATDNNWKNTLLAAYREQDGGYTLRRTIWDLNYVFGDVYRHKWDLRFTVHEEDSEYGYTAGKDSTWDFEAFLRSDPSLQEALASKWRLWRQSGITAEWICGLALENYRTLEESGALGREMDRWPGSQDSGQALEDMETWIRRRFEFLDAYFAAESEGPEIPSSPRE